jgi:beta propeller repeat protein
MKYIVLISFCLLAFLGLCAPVWARAEFRITNNDWDQDYPAVSGNYVVWEDSRNSSLDIYGYDLVTHTEFPICTDAATQRYPLISGNIVIWSDERDGKISIYGYNLATHTEFPIRTDLAGLYSYAISNGIVVWTDLRNTTENANNWDIYGYNIATQQEFPICTAPGAQLVTGISGDTVVWGDLRSDPNTSFCCSAGVIRSIYGYHLSTQSEFLIAAEAGDSPSPLISGNLVMWREFPDDNIITYGYDLDSGTKFPIPIPIGAPADSKVSYLSISGDRIIWSDRRNGDRDLFGCDLAKGVEFSICNDLGEQYNTAIDGNFVAWTDYRNGNFDIYGRILDNYNLAVTADPNTGGTVTGAGTYTEDSTVPITATAKTGWRFTGWSGTVADPNATTTTVFVDTSKTVTANFTRKPPAPTDLTATALAYNQIRLDWSFTGTVTGFKIYRRIGAGVWSTTPIKTVGNTVRTFTNTGLLANTLYTYRICAYNAYGSSPVVEASATTMIYIAAPTTLKAKAYSSHCIGLSWIDKSTNETGFYLERRIGTTGCWSAISSVPANTIGYINGNVSPGTTYNYRVQAIADDACSAYSNIVSVATPVYIAPPTDLTAAVVSPTQVNLHWTDNANNEAGYKIERRKSTVTTWTVIKTLGANITSFNNTGLIAGTTYIYRVRAYKNTAYSAYSNEITSAILPPVPIHSQMYGPGSMLVKIFAPDNSNTPLLTQTVSLDATGQGYLIPTGLAGGTYAVWGKETTHLSKRVSNWNYDPNALVPVDFGILPAGDLNNDNSVDMADYDYMVSVWYTNNTIADINHDGIVDLTDYNLMVAWWGQTGEE